MFDFPIKWFFKTGFIFNQEKKKKKSIFSGFYLFLSKLIYIYIYIFSISISIRLNLSY
jgi:surface polysaccharide O-acyltransferase-like enzyme